MNQPERHLLRRRWVYRTLREVYLEGEHEIVKRFVHHPGRRDWRRVWKREDRALRRLEGLPVPKTHGYTSGRCAEGPEFILRKQFIAGTPLVKATITDAADMAQLLARIHQRGVVTNDPAIGNFLRIPQGELYFIDFGRARTFNFRTPLLYIYIGKDLARAYRTGLEGQTDLWTSFRQTYYAIYKLHPILHWLVETSMRYWLQHKQRR